MNEKDKNKAIKLLAQGESQDKIAKALGVNQSTISRLRVKNEELVKKETERFIEALPDITDQLIRDIKTSNLLSKVFSGETDIEELPPLLTQAILDPKYKSILTTFINLSYKKQSDILRSVGVYPAQSPSTVFQTLIQQNIDKAVISPAILDVLKGHVEDILDEE